MYVAMNRFKIEAGAEEEFEAVWKARDSKLADTPGFRDFKLLRGPTDEAAGITLYVSHSVWQSEADFLAWTRSQNFREAHRKAGDKRSIYREPPQFEGFTPVEGA